MSVEDHAAMEPVGGVPLLHFFDSNAIRTSLHARVSYLVTFIGLNGSDVDALRSIAPLIRPVLPDIVDALYRRLWSFDITRKALVKPAKPNSSPEELVAAERDRMKYLASFFNHWVLKIFIADWEDLQTFGYFDRVGISHAGVDAFRHRGERGNLRVDYVHIGLLLGYLQGTLTKTILALEKPTMEEKTNTLIALNKVMWIQNDLFSRHYTQPVERLNVPADPVPTPAPFIPPPSPDKAASAAAHAPHPIPADYEGPRCPFSGAAEDPYSGDEPWSDDSDDDGFPLSSDEDGEGEESSSKKSPAPGSTTTAESGAEEAVKGLKI